jgi:hypothetical protein
MCGRVREILLWAALELAQYHLRPRSELVLSRNDRIFPHLGQSEDHWAAQVRRKIGGLVARKKAVSRPAHVVRRVLDPVAERAPQHLATDSNDVNLLNQKSAPELFRSRGPEKAFDRELFDRVVLSDPFPAFDCFDCRELQELSLVDPK